MSLKLIIFATALETFKIANIASVQNNCRYYIIIHNVKLYNELSIIDLKLVLLNLLQI